MPETIDDIRTVSIATRTPYRELRSSNNDFIADIEKREQDWRTVLKPQRDRLYRNIRAYCPVDGSSWDRDSYNQVTSEGRHAVNIDIASRKMDTLTGSILAERWNFDFQALDLYNNPALKKTKHWYHADKEQYNYSAAERKCCLRGLLHSAYQEMLIRYDLRPTGAIGFVSPQAGQILPDPDWLTDDIWDWVRGMKEGYFTAQQIVDKWETGDPTIRSIAKQEKVSGETYGAHANVDTFEDAPRTWGSKHKVIEYRYIEERKTTRLYGKTKEGDWLEFPLDIESRDDVEFFMKTNGITSWQQIRELPYRDRRLNLAICVPDLTRTTLLFEGEHDIQCGTLGWFRFSACREMGIDKGMMDAAIDLVRTLNYRETKKDDIIAALAADVNVVNLDVLDNDVNDLGHIKKGITKPGFTFGVHGDPSKAVYKLSPGAVPASILQDIGNFIELFDRALPVTPALEGRGPGEESGVLFEMRHAVTKLGTLILYDNWRQHLMDIAEGWYNQARITYKDQYRKVRDTETNQDLEFNKPAYIANGTDVKRAYINSIADMPRAKVYITLRKDSPTERVAQRAMLYDITKILSAHPELFIDEIRILTNRIIQTIELDPEERVKMETLGTLKEVRDTLRILGEIEGIKANTLQAQVLQQQATAALQQISGQLMQQAQAAGQQQPSPEVMSRPQPLPPGGEGPQVGPSPEEQFMDVPMEVGTPS